MEVLLAKVLLWERLEVDLLRGIVLIDQIFNDLPVVVFSTLIKCECS